jgi:hypothetical protein
VGAKEGDIVGKELGELEGDRVGGDVPIVVTSVGDDVGATEGALVAPSTVGASVGASVGAPVGASVAAAPALKVQVSVIFTVALPVAHPAFAVTSPEAGMTTSCPLLAVRVFVQSPPSIAAPPPTSNKYLLVDEDMTRVRVSPGVYSPPHSTVVPPRSKVTVLVESEMAGEPIIDSPTAKDLLQAILEGSAAAGSGDRTRRDATRAVLKVIALGV